VRQRTLKWAVVGVCVAIGWTAYSFATAPQYVVAVGPPRYEISLSRRLLWAVEIVTCPALLAGMIFYWMVPLNGVIYAIVGFAVALVQSRSQTVIFKLTYYPRGRAARKLGHSPLGK
jgi:hypothetical protein